MCLRLPLLLQLVFVVGRLEDNSAAEEGGNENETGQKENIYYRTAKNSCQKYVFGRMHGK